MTVTDLLPGLRVTAAPAAAEPEPLRTDVAVLLGGFTRGPVGDPCRVQSWTEARSVFGPIDGRALTPYAVQGFFANGGRTAWLIRVPGAGAATASARWTVGGVTGAAWAAGAPARGGFAHPAYTVRATSPGAWANRTRVTIAFRASSLAGPPVVSVRVAAPGEPVETFADLPPGEVAARLSRSRLIRLTVADERRPPPADTGPLTATWQLDLAGGADPQPTVEGYLAALGKLARLPEPALVAVPDLADLPGGREAVLPVLLDEVDALRDRLLVLDAAGDTADAALAWLTAVKASVRDRPGVLRTVAVYHPRVRVPDPANPAGGLRPVPCSGHVLGLIARLDGERGPAHTPANAVLADVADLEVEHPPTAMARLIGAGVNLLRAPTGRGPLVWGGRVPADPPVTRHLAHRRLIHLLVRAIRRVADPLVFEANGPELRFTLVRGVISVLLAAHRSGALAGDRPEQAFRVVCDDRNNPPDADPATVVCDIDVTPADPMEVITIRLVLGQDRPLEVIER